MEYETTLYVLEYPTKRIAHLPGNELTLEQIVERYGLQYITNGDGTPLEIPLSRIREIYPFGVDSKIIDLNPFYIPCLSRRKNAKPKALPIYTDRTRKYEIWLVTAEQLLALDPAHDIDHLRENGFKI